MSKPNLNNLIAELQAKYPDLTIKRGGVFKYSPPHTIFYADDPNSALLLLHEVGHYLLKRDDYDPDIELINIEAGAWANAKKLCTELNIEWDEDFAQDRLDTYRNYLHSRSTCTKCNINGYQDPHGIYHCPLCKSHWN